MSDRKSGPQEEDTHSRSDENVIEAVRGELFHLDEETREHAIKAFKRGYSLAEVKMLFGPDIGLSDISSEKQHTDR